MAKKSKLDSQDSQFWLSSVVYDLLARHFGLSRAGVSLCLSVLRYQIPSSDPVHQT
jgi:hypothetical protein